MANKELVLQFPIRSQAIHTEEIAVQEMMSGLETLIKIGAIKGPIDEILKDHKVDLESGYTIAYLEPDALYDGSKLNTVGASKILEVPKELTNEVDLSEHDKTFSTATIQERLRLAKYNPKQRFRLIVMDYKRYYAAKKPDFKKHPENFHLLRNMFLTDLMGLFNEIIPFIAEGKQINALIGLGQVTPTMATVARDLSIIYKRALLTEKSSGQINKSIYKDLKRVYGQFLDQLIEVVFPGCGEFRVIDKKKLGFIKADTPAKKLVADSISSKEVPDKSSSKNPIYNKIASHEPNVEVKKYSMGNSLKAFSESNR